MHKSFWQAKCLHATCHMGMHKLSPGPKHCCTVIRPTFKTKAILVALLQRSKSEYCSLPGQCEQHATWGGTGFQAGGPHQRRIPSLQPRCGGTSGTARWGCPPARPLRCAASWACAHCHCHCCPPQRCHGLPLGCRTGWAPQHPQQSAQSRRATGAGAWEVSAALHRKVMGRL